LWVKQTASTRALSPGLMSEERESFAACVERIVSCVYFETRRWKGDWNLAFCGAGGCLAMTCMQTTSVRRRISLFSRSSELFDQSWRQCSLGKLVKTRISGPASSSSAAVAGGAERVRLRPHQPLG